MKRTAAAAGLDPERFAGHSLRAGLATAAAMADVPEHAIMRQTRHRSVEVFRGHVRVASLFKKNAAAAVTRSVDQLDAANGAAGDAETRIRCATLEAELRAAQTLLEAAKRREEDLRQERDAWRQQAERLAIAAPASRSWRWPWRR